ncbi:hypothetical protein AB0368_15850 [Actinoplanes sp. NPDC051475]|uniref:hypothetical protein n=1 Tax=Actinoplanes sp. NPDC051475 TaxID=3157225 RepID=UPI00344C1B23
MSFAADAGGVISEGEFRDLLAKMDTKLKDIDASSAKLFDRSNRAMLLLPPGVSDMLHDALVKLRDLMAKFFDEIAKVVLNPGWPPGLYSTGNAWTSQVGGPISSLSGKLTTDQMRIDNFWTGPAADAYSAILPSQQKAVEAIKQATDVLDSNLTKAAAGIVVLWIGVIAAVASYLIELVAESGAAATVVGAPPAAAAAGVSTAKVIGLVIAAIGVFATYAALLADSISTMRQTMYANSAFPDGKWPTSTAADFNDGSLSDGDTTDWRIKTHD